MHLELAVRAVPQAVVWVVDVALLVDPDGAKPLEDDGLPKGDKDDAFDGKELAERLDWPQLLPRFVVEENEAVHRPDADRRLRQREVEKDRRELERSVCQSEREREGERVHVHVHVRVRVCMHVCVSACV